MAVSGGYAGYAPVQALARSARVNVLIGPPGTGKTTELSRLVREAHEAGWRPLVASLTRTAAREVAGRDLPIDDRRIGTLHAHAYRALGHPQIAEGRLREWNEWVAREHPTEGWEVPEGYGKRSRLDEPNDIGSAADVGEDGDGQRLLEAVGVLRARMVGEAHWPSTRLRAFWGAWRTWKSDRGYLDFSDLLERCLELEARPAVDYDALYLDEAQDLSRLEMSLALRWAAGARACVVVGDPRQNLYEWRGSEAEVFYELLRCADRSRVLARSYRVPRAVHAVACDWVARLDDGIDAEYLPRDAEGRVERSGAWIKDAALVRSMIERDLDDGKEVMVLTSCAYLLDPLIGELRERGIPFWNRYRPHNGRWNPLLWSHKPSSTSGRVVGFSRVDDRVWGDESRGWTNAELAAWADSISANVFRKGTKAELKTLDPEAPFDPTWLAERVPDTDDLAAIFRGDLWWFEQHLVPGQVSKFTYPLQVASARGPRALAEPPKLTVGTIHSVKGGQADRVYVWPDLSPAGYAEWLDPATRDRLVRLFYVAMTRAREELVLCAPSSSLAVTW